LRKGVGFDGPFSGKNAIFVGVIAYMNVLTTFLRKISHIGYTDDLPDYEKKRVVIFNRLNFTGFCMALLRLLFVAFFTPAHFSYQTLLANLPLVLIFPFMLWLMHHQYFKLATRSSFIVVPPILALANWLTNDAGLEMFVVLYMMFCFFFLHRRSNIIRAFVYCLFFYVLMHFKLSNYAVFERPGSVYFILSAYSYLGAFAMIFATMFLIKYSVWAYEKSIREKSEQLRASNLETIARGEELNKKAAILRQKTEELMELNHVKTKLFSIISHDLRTSVYSVKNIFDALEKGYITGEELVQMAPQANQEINNSIDLMNNLLTWARNQFNDNKVAPQAIDLRQITDTVLKLFEAQAAKKGIALKNAIGTYLFAFADNDMVMTVLRNLVSNAIKFTPQGGSVTVRTEPDGDYVRLVVADTGVGMDAEAQVRIFNNEYYTTPGTDSEMGTGLGLAICRDFIVLNHGRLDVQSGPGKGTSFVVTLPYNQTAARK
jgi:two-component system, sensor histidine kinase and response regulator